MHCAAAKENPYRVTAKKAIRSASCPVDWVCVEFNINTVEGDSREEKRVGGKAREHRETHATKPTIFEKRPAREIIGSAA